MGEPHHENYQVNLFRPKKGHMRDEVAVTLAILFGWGAVTFGFQLLVYLCRGTRLGELLTHFTLFNLPIHFWFTGQLLPLWFIALCVLYNLYIDRITEYHSRKRDRTYE